jgi:hypothetical protein
VSLYIFGSSVIAEAKCIRSHGEAEDRHFRRCSSQSSDQLGVTGRQLVGLPVYHMRTVLHALPPLLKSSVTLHVLSAKSSG